MNQIVLTSQKHDVLQDVIVWERKRYQARPRLCQSDGEITKYRRYCEQFYPELSGYAHVKPDGHLPAQEPNEMAQASMREDKA